MSVGKQGSKDVTITYDDAPGGTPRVITDFIMDLGGVEIQVDTDDSQAFGDAWNEITATGNRSVADIEVGGNFDTTPTTGPHVTLRVVDADADPNAATRTLVMVFGDSKTFTLETRLVKYRVEGKKGKLTTFKATIRPTGAAVWS